MGCTARGTHRIPPAFGRGRARAVTGRRVSPIPANSFHEKAALCRAAENTCFFATVNCASDGVADHFGSSCAPTGHCSVTSLTASEDCSLRISTSPRLAGSSHRARRLTRTAGQATKIDGLSYGFSCARLSRRDRGRSGTGMRAPVRRDRHRNLAVHRWHLHRTR